MASITRALLLLAFLAVLLVDASPTDRSLTKRELPPRRSFEASVEGSTCHTKGYDSEQKKYCENDICGKTNDKTKAKCPGVEKKVGPIAGRGLCKATMLSRPGIVEESHCVCYYKKDDCPEDPRSWSCKKGGVAKWLFCKDD